MHTPKLFELEFATSRPCTNLLIYNSRCGMNYAYLSISRLLLTISADAKQGQKADEVLTSSHYTQKKKPHNGLSLVSHMYVLSLTWWYLSCTKIIPQSATGLDSGCNFRRQKSLADPSPIVYQLPMYAMDIQRNLKEHLTPDVTD